MHPLKTFLAIVLLAISSCDCGEEELVETCPQPQPCFLEYGMSNEEKNIIVGDSLESYKDQICSFGTTECSEDTKKVVCSGIKYPQKEICDGIDNDCNGEVDDGNHLIISGFDWQNPCLETEQGVCLHSEARCFNGQWFCIPTSPFFGEEVCDGKDNDCDGEVDEDIEDIFVYDGPPETLNIGECRAGIKYCEEGREITFGMRTPIPEICGNGDDDDCDGLTDEREENLGQYDFALLIDFSGSMYTYIDSVATALCTWSANQNFTDSKFAIVAVAVDDNNYGIVTLTDFTDAQTACDVIINALVSQLQTMSEEYQVDALINALGVPNDLELSWSHRTRKIVIFSDEEPQYSSQFGFNTLAEAMSYATSKCVLDNTTVSVFTQFSYLVSNYWNELVVGCGGYLEYLMINPHMMIEKLNYWFGEEC